VLLSCQVKGWRMPTPASRPCARCRP
jgi:hypothetical protein